MRDKRIQLIYFSLGGSEAKQISLGWKKIAGMIGITLSVVFVLIIFIIGLFTDMFHNRQVAHLSKANSQLRDFLQDVTFRLENLQTQVQVIEKNDEDMRIFVDLPQIDSDMRKFGRGGHASPSTTPISAVTGENREEAVKIQRVIDNLEKRVSFARLSMEEISGKYQEDQFKFKHTPSVRPIPNARVTSRFEYRPDPFTEQPRFHEGWDFSAPRGTNVLATADGKVVETHLRYLPNLGYGRYIVVDHGYGVKTRYAHLEKVLVQEGEVITRYTVIAKVGDTGRSTAPHLHYEVLKDDKQVDPKDFILDE